MDDDRRLRYLAALGIQVWCRRDRPANPAPPVAGDGMTASRDPEGDPMAREMALDRDGAIAGMDWERLEQAVADCQACPLWEGRIQTVFGVGARDADLMVIGEAPGADEDRRGEPFVGRAGKLLDQMLAAIGLTRHQVYIANILKCRPPGNRNPREPEMAACHPFLMRQIALIHPRLLLAVGGVSAHALLETTEAVGRLRGRRHRFGPDQIPLLVTYHPAYLLRAPRQKARAWEDLQEVARRLQS